jgi:phospholipid/cholesterol/gamma-HCH transport system substrate-binding protein
MVLVATLLLIAGLYLVGQQRNIFSANATLFAHFHDINGLMPGNNVRFNGYSLGRVVEITPYNDSLVEVMFSIDQDWLKYVSVNALVSLGTDGLLGNKILEIDPGKPFGREIRDGDTLQVRAQPDMDLAMRTLNETNNNLLAISDDIKSITARFSNDNSLWRLLADTSLSPLLRSAVVNMEVTSSRAARITGDLSSMVGSVRAGKGSFGAILADTSLFTTIHQTVVNIESITDTLAIVSGNFNEFTNRTLHGRGNLATFVNDTTLVGNLNEAVGEIRKTATTADETMKLLRQSRLLKRYLKRQKKQ